MLNQTGDWLFVNRPSRPALTAREVRYWRSALQKLLKVGIELEYNLPDVNGTCDRQNFLCPCRVPFAAKKPMPDTSNCYEQCTKWNGGECNIAQEHSCLGIYCREFRSPCSGCNKYDRGCDNCEELYTLDKDPRYIRENIGKVLKPTRFVGDHGAAGVYKVCRDGSLAGDGGIEIATVGRRVQFDTLYDQMSHIMKLCADAGGFVDERCSIHTHLLASYLTPGFSGNDQGAHFVRNDISEMERPLPEIILANFHQLVRRYHCALIWLSAAGTSRGRLTRWEKFRKSVLPYSAVRHRMPMVTQETRHASKSKRKYAMMNYEQIQFDDRGRVRRLHVEGRYMDGNLSPATVVAHACLLYGLMLKAVEVSRYGVLEAGGKAYMDKQREIYCCLCNNDGPWDGFRHSDTSKLDPHIPELRRQSRQLVRLIKDKLSKLSPADEILRKLADKPIALRRMEGKSWEQIEAELCPMRENHSETDQALLRIIGLGAICECDLEEEWVEAATYQLAVEQKVQDNARETNALRGKVRSFLNKQRAENQISWSKKIGGFLSNR